MSRKASQRLLIRSYAWIRANLDAQNLDVPSEFVKEWIYGSNEEELTPSGFQMGVFVFGYCQHQLMARKVPDGTKLGVPSARIFELFQRWQLKLAIAEIHRMTDMRVAPLPL